MRGQAHGTRAGPRHQPCPRRPQDRRKRAADRCAEDAPTCAPKSSRTDLSRATAWPRWLKITALTSRRSRKRSASRTATASDAWLDALTGRQAAFRHRHPVHRPRHLEQGARRRATCGGHTVRAPPRGLCRRRARRAVDRRRCRAWVGRRHARQAHPLSMPTRWPRYGAQRCTCLRSPPATLRRPRLPASLCPRGRASRQRCKTPRHR